jgi:transcriptional regulator with XRE-family HTH domain
LIGQHAFGSRLRTQRERQGVSLAAIAESTKIKLSLLDGLERGDVSHWPRGLFRRAYLRDYAAAIGLPAEPLVAEFVRIFPEDGTPAEALDVEAPEPMRLGFPAGPELASHRALAGAQGAAVELAVVVAMGLAIAWAAGTPFLTTCGVTALLYYPLATTVTGRTLSPTRIGWLVGRVTPGPVELATEAPPLYLVSRTATQSPVPSAPTVEDVAAPRTAAG